MAEDSEQAELAKAVDRLLQRLEKIGGDVWVPQWLVDVASKEDLAEWRSICKSYRDLDRSDRILEFAHAIRREYPDMAEGFEEQLEDKVRELNADVALRRREGVTEEMEKDFARREGHSKEDHENEEITNE